MGNGSTDDPRVVSPTGAVETPVYCLLVNTAWLL
jgi:hypothetical protein